MEETVPAWQILRDGRPLVAKILMQVVQHLVLALGPVNGDDSGVEVVVVPG